MTKRLATALVSLLLLGTAPSQPPAPSARKSQSSQPQQQPAGAHQQAAPDIRGTDQAPLRVQIQPSAKTESEAAKEQRDEQAKATEQRWTVGLGVTTAAILLLQLFVFGYQALKLKHTIVKMDEIASGQGADMKASIAEATRAATAMEKTATAIGVAAEAARQNAGVAKDTLRSHRAFLAFTSYEMRRFPTLEKLERAEISFRMGNSGTFPARLLKFKSGVCIGSALPVVPNYFLEEDSGGAQAPGGKGGHTKIYVIPIDPRNRQSCP
jgi:hypothetical protein